MDGAPKRKLRVDVPLLVLLALASGQYAWNAWAQSALWGYDAGGHVGYVYGLLQTGALPHPLAGWSTFHPPLYYLLGAATWVGLEPLGPHAIIVGLRLIGAAGVVAAGAMTHVLAVRLGASAGTAATAAGGVLFLPAAQLSASMVGNEALGAGLCGLAFGPILALQRRPDRAGAAAFAGVLLGLALVTKYSAVWLLPAAAVPFLRRPDTGGLRSALLLFALAAGIAAPVYVRNLILTEDLVPMTRTSDPMRRVENLTIVRERRLADYLTVPLDCGRYPWTTEHDDDGRFTQMHEPMASVPCIAYTSLWFDPYRVRISQIHADDVRTWAHALLLLGLVPTLLVCAGLASALREAVRRRARSPDAPLVVAALAGLASFVGFTWVAPSTAAAKGSYMLPLLVPAALFFARACTALPRAFRAAACAVTACALVASIWIFTTGIAVPANPRMGTYIFWRAIAMELPESHIGPAVFELLYD